MPAVGTVAVLPVKRFARAKQRLRPAVDGAPRERLAAAMVGDVLDVVSRCEALDALVVVTAEPVAAELAAERGARVVHDPAETGQSAAALLGIGVATGELGARRVVLVPGDTPALDPLELAQLLACDEPIVIVPDRHGTGTNALLLAPPDAIEPSFGEGSRARHEAAASASGLAWAVAELPSLMLDVDTPEDLAALRAGAGAGGRTGSLL